MASAAVVALLLAAGGAAGQSMAEFQQWRRTAQPTYPDDNGPSPARATLGEALFYDRRLSGNGQLACVSCHLPGHGWSENRPVSIGVTGKPMLRNSQSLINIGFNRTEVMWAGKYKTLEEQAIGPMLDPHIMASDVPALLAMLSNDPDYAARFAQAYPGEKLDLTLVAKAIANFERTIVSKDTRFDQWVAGKGQALSSSQQRGMRLFMNPNKTNCIACHVAPTFSDNGFHNIGLGSRDIGRGQFSSHAAMQGAFKTPQLRGVANTAPYMHDGSLPTLEAVVDHYDRGGGAVLVGTLSPAMRPLHLSPAEKRDLVAFLKALSSY